MTVLAMARTADGIAFAADSQTTAGGLIVADDKTKIWRLPGTAAGPGDWLFAATGTVSVSQVIRYNFTPPVADEADLMRYMITSFVPAISKVLVDGGKQQKVNEVTKSGGLGLLIAHSGRLFDLSNDYALCEVLSGFSAAGTGTELALGAMHALSDSDLHDDLSAREIASAGAAAAIRFDVYCGGGIRCEELPTIDELT